VHEKGRCKKINAFVHHYGYVYDTKEEKQRHFERNAKPLLQLIREEPGEVRWRVQMLQEYQSMRMGVEMQQLAEESERMFGEKRTPHQELIREDFLCAELVAMQIQEKSPKMLETAQSCLNGKRHTTAGRCAVTSFAAQAAFDTGAYGKCVKYCREYLKLYAECRNSRRDEQEQLFEEMQLFLGERISRKGYRTVCMLLCCSLSKEGRADEIPEDCLPVALEYLENWLNGEANFLKYADTFWELGAAGRIPLEEMLLGLELPQWMAQVRMLEQNCDWERWRGYCDHFRQIQTRDDIRYAYFFSRYYYAVCTKKGIVGMGYAAMRSFLQGMADSFLDYAHMVYTDRAFEGEMEFLPKHCIAAEYIQKMFPDGGADIAEQKRWLTKAAEAWDAFRPAAEHYEKLLALQGKPVVLSIAVMASNRGDTIGKCLDSLAVIRETIPCELIVLDTGCSEGLHGTLAEYADKMDRFTWCDDFSAARNATIAMAEGEWFLYLDDDEWFTDTQELLDFFTSGEYREYDCASYIQRNYLDMRGMQYTDAWVSRMVRLTPEMHFESKIHEYFAPGGTTCKGLKSIVDHYGYVFESDEALRKHYERNRTLLLEMMEQEPDNIRWWVQLIQEYRAVNEYQELYDFGEKCLKKLAGHDETIDNIYLGSFYAAKIAALKGMDKWEEGLAECKKALADKRNTPLFAAYADHMMTNFCYWLGDYDGVEQYAKDYLSYLDFYRENEPLLFVHKRTVLVGECFDDVKVKEVYSELILSGLKRGSTENLLKYLDFLEWDKPNAYVFEDMVPTLLEMEDAMADDPGFERLFEVMTKNTALADYYLKQKSLTEQRKMGEQIKEQLRLLVANGMTEQAKQILPSIREMLPEDEELEEIEKSLVDAQEDEQ
jgi:glycosyltransferase involved in cell wall biosynthesis